MRRDLDLLDLVGEVGGEAPLTVGRDQRRLHRVGGRERAADGAARDDAKLVHLLHRIAQKDFGVEVLAAVSGDQVVQVQRQRRIADALAIVAVRRQIGVAPALVRRHLIQEQIDLVRFLRAAGDTIRRRCADLEAADGGKVIVDQAIVQQVHQHGGNRGNGKRAAHERLPRFR